VSYEQALYKWWGILLRDFVNLQPTDEPVNTAVAWYAHSSRGHSVSLLDLLKLAGVLVP
jgi:hypothetical protein